MAGLTIPKEYAGGMSRLANLSDQEVDDIVHALERASEGVPGEILSLVRTALPSLSSEHAREIVETLRSLYGARTGMDIPLEEFVRGIVDAIRKSSTSGAEPEDPARTDRLEVMFRRLLGVRPLSMISKAKDLQYEHENIFCDARVITDVRPVFDSDVKQPPAGFVITNMLKIEYHHCGKHTEIHIAMDSDDINNLMGVLWRSREKSETIAALSAQWKMDKLSE